MPYQRIPCHQLTSPPQLARSSPAHPHPPPLPQHREASLFGLACVPCETPEHLLCVSIEQALANQIPHRRDVVFGGPTSGATVQLCALFFRTYVGHSCDLYNCANSFLTPHTFPSYYVSGWRPEPLLGLYIPRFGHPNTSVVYHIRDRLRYVF